MIVTQNLKWATDGLPHTVKVVQKPIFNIVLFVVKNLIKIYNIMVYIKRFLWVIQFIIMIPVHIIVFLFIGIPVILAAQILEFALVWPIYYIITGDFYLDEYKSISNAINDVLFMGEKFKLKRWN